jgi:hypothetical protein
MRKDCDDRRAICNQNICRKIDDLQNRESAATAEGKITLKDINASMLSINTRLSKIEGGFDRLLSEFDKR